MIVAQDNAKHFLWRAVEEGEISLVRNMIDHDPSRIDVSDGKFSRTALMTAAACGDLNIVQFLVQRGAKLDLRDKHGYTALHFAAGCGHSTVVALLLEKGADPKIKDQIGLTPLMTACRHGHVVVVRLLLHYQGRHDVNEATGTKRRTALWVACERGHTEVAKALIYEGYADPTMCDSDGKSPVQIAWEKGHYATAEMIEAVIGKIETLCVPRSPIARGLASLLIRV